MKLIYSLHSCVICSYHAGNVHSVMHCSDVCLFVLYLFIRLVFANVNVHSIKHWSDVCLSVLYLFIHPVFAVQCYACAVLAMGLCLCLVCFMCTVRVCIV